MNLNELIRSLVELQKEINNLDCFVGISVNGRSFMNINDVRVDRSVYGDTRVVVAYYDVHDDNMEIDDADSVEQETEEEVSK